MTDSLSPLTAPEAVPGDLRLKGEQIPAQCFKPMRWCPCGAPIFDESEDVKLCYGCQKKQREQPPVLTVEGVKVRGVAVGPQIPQYQIPTTWPPVVVTEA